MFFGTGDEVNHLDRFVYYPSGGQPVGIMEKERDLDIIVIEYTLLPQPVLAELEALVGRERDYRIVQLTGPLESLDDAPDLHVHQRNHAVVGPATQVDLLAGKLRPAVSPKRPLLEFRLALQFLLRR